MATGETHTDGPEAWRDRMSGLRHEALNLLMVIDLACESLQHSLPHGHRSRDDVEQIATAQRRLAELIDRASQG